jgi:hypothetical protein
MNIGVTLKTAEKKFGPALPGSDQEYNTLSAIRYAGGKGKKFAGVPGIRPEAEFYVHFPLDVDWTRLESKKGIPDFVNDLKESGPQGEQDREEKVAAFVEQYRAVREVAERKLAAANRKKEAGALRLRLAPLLGPQEVTVTIGGETFAILFKITKDKAGKIKIAGSV